MNETEVSVPPSEEQQKQLLLATVSRLAREIHPHHSPVMLTAESRLEGDAGIDSLGRMELLLRIEKEFGRTLPENEAMEAVTVGDLFRALQHASLASLKTTARPAVIPSPSPEEFSVPAEAATLSEALSWHVERHPGRVHAHLFDSTTGTTIPLTYEELYGQALLVAGGLQRRGIRPADAVGIMLPTGADYLHVFMGILLSGGVPVPIYPPHRIEQIEEHMKRQFGILKTANARLLVTESEATRRRGLILANLPAMQDVITSEDMLREARPGGLVRASAEDTAFLQFTSGSTGNPKGVVLSHRNLLSNIRAMGEAVAIGPNDCVVSWLPLYHDMGLIGSWLGSLYFGLPLVLMSPLAFLARPVRWLRAIHNARATISAAPNFAYDICATRLSDEDLAGLDLSSWRRALNGAEPVHADTLDRFARRFAPYGFHEEALTPVFGLAENSVGLLFPPAKRGPRIDRIRREPFYREGMAVPADADESDVLRSVFCGSPIRGHEIRIVDENDRDVKERCLGRLLFRGPSSTREYIGNPEATASLFCAGGTWLDSGDIAYMADGEVCIAGRAKEMIIKGGRNIYPYELELAVGEIQGVRKGGVAVFGAGDPLAASLEKLVVLAETRERRPEQLARIREQITDLSIEMFQTPPDDIVLAELRTVPVTTSGKIRRAACRALYETGNLGKRRGVWMQLLRLGLASLPGFLRRFRRRTGELAYAGMGYLLLGAIAPFAWAGVVLSPAEGLRHRILRGSGRLLIALSGTRFRIHGMEHYNAIAGNPLIIVSNHASYLDPLLLCAAFPAHLRFTAKAELSRNPLVRIFLKRLRVQFVERFDAKEGVADVRRMEEDGRDPLVFFSEGTFNEVPGLRPFRMGAFVLACRAGRPILPVALKGTREKLRDVDFFLRRGDVELNVSPAILPAGTEWKDALSLRDQVRDVILEHCGERDCTEAIVPADASHSEHLAQ